MKLTTVLGVVLLVLVLGAGVAYWQGWPPFGSNNVLAPVSSQAAASANAFGVANAQDFLSFTDPSYGYQLKYPVGYVAGSSVDPLTNESLVSFVAKPAQGDPEVLLLDSVDGAFDPLVKSVLDDARNESGLSDLHEHALNVPGAQSMTFEMPDPAVSDLNAQAGLTQDATRVVTVYGCTNGPNGPYTVLFTARVPLPLSQDLPMINYVLHSFRCPTTPPTG